MRRTTIRARLLGTVMLVGLLALAAGPFRAEFGPVALATPSSVSLFGDPYAHPRLGPWPSGVFESTPGSDGGVTRVSAAPVARHLTVAEALASAPTPDHVAVSAPAGGAALPGVGTVVTDGDVNALMSLPAADRVAAIGQVTSLSGAALGLVAMGGLPGTATRLVDSGSSDHRRLLLGQDDLVKQMVDVWAQQRPDLSVLVTPSGTGSATTVSAAGVRPAAALANVGLAATAASTDQVDVADVVPSMFARLDQGAALVSPRLFSSTAGVGLLDLEGHSLTSTAAGLAWTVAALAVPPGSHAAPATVSGGIEALVVARTEGGASVLLWNPGATAPVTVDLPDGHGGILRYTVTATGGELTAALLSH